MFTRFFFKAIIVMAAVLAPTFSFAENPTPIVLDETHKGSDEDKGKPRHRAPGQHVAIEAMYAEGVLSCSGWSDADGLVTLTVTDQEGAMLFHASCTGRQLATGVTIGQFDSFIIALTTASGSAYTGEYAD